MLRVIAATTAAALCAVLTMLAQAPSGGAAGRPQQPQPMFRASVDVVQFDVTVLDKQHRPVRGLTAADFTVVESGQTRPIVAFTPVEIPGPTPPSAPWMRDVAPDVVVNNSDIDRILVIVMDDAYSGLNRSLGVLDPWILRAGKAIARDAINSLGPRDLAAVVYTFLGRPQNFTSDHAKLLEAVEAFRPKYSPVTVGGGRGTAIGAAGVPLGCTYGTLVTKLIPDCIVNTLRNVAAVLPETPPRRKVILFISQYNQVGGNVDIDQASPLTEMFRVLQRANAAIYAYSPGGLQLVDGGTSDTLHTLAESTGGRAVVDTNAPWEQIPMLFDETSAYYILGVQTSAVRQDGQFHNVAIKVNRPGVEVLARKGYYAPTTPSKKKTTPPSPIDAALASSFPAGGLSISVQAAPFAAREPHRSDIGVIVGVRAGTPAAAAPQRFTVVVKAFDKNWRERASSAQAVQTTTAIGPDALIEVPSRLKLPPGRYELRAAVEGDGRAGSVFTDLEVPDFSNGQLSVSGLLLTRTGPGRTNVLTDLAAGAPTIARIFAASEAVAAFVRVYAGGKSPVAAVPTHVTIVDSNDKLVTDTHSTIAASQFTGRSADFRFDLPIGDLRHGEHLLRLEIGEGDHRAGTHGAVRRQVGGRRRGRAPRKKAVSAPPYAPSEGGRGVPPEFEPTYATAVT